MLWTIRGRHFCASQTMDRKHKRPIFIRKKPERPFLFRISVTKKSNINGWPQEKNGHASYSNLGNITSYILKIKTVQNYIRREIFHFNFEMDHPYGQNIIYTTFGYIFLFSSQHQVHIKPFHPFWPHFRLGTAWQTRFRKRMLQTKRSKRGCVTVKRTSNRRRKRKPPRCCSN